MRNTPEYLRLRFRERRTLLRTAALLGAAMVASLMIHYVPAAAGGRSQLVRIQVMTAERGPIEVSFFAVRSGWPLTDTIERDVDVAVPPEASVNKLEIVRKAMAAQRVAGFEEAAGSPGVTVVERRDFAALVNRLAQNVFVAPFFMGLAAGCGLVVLLGDRRAFCARNRLCPRCLYDLSGSSGACPECGASAGGG